MNNNFILFLGENSPYLLFLISIFILIDKSYLIVYYLFGYMINLIINNILKNIIKEKRPTKEYEKNFNQRIKMLNADKYGMPSGHAQSIFYSLIFIYQSFNNIYLSLFYLLLCFITLYQRIEMGYHSLQQVIVGAIVGSIVGYLSYKLYDRKKK